MKDIDYIQANRKSWNETSEAHAKGYVVELKQQIIDPDFSTFDAIEKDIFSKIQLANKNVIQLCCNNGRELISVKRQGAGRCVGIDLSDNAIAQAKTLSQLAKTDIEFICGDVFKIDQSLFGEFDLVYVTIGAIGWLPDIKQFFEIISKLLNPQGKVFIYEMHPILNMYEDIEPGIISESYFNRGPFREEGEADYFDKTTVIENEYYWFHHTLGDILTALIDAGMELKHFKEYEHDISMIHEATAAQKNKPPMCFTLVANKK